VAQDGETPLQFAARAGHEAAIKALVVAKADVNTKHKVRGGGGLEGKGGGASDVMLILWFGI
jgi:ankyrin repeat protein